MFNMPCPSCEGQIIVHLLSHARELLASLPFKGEQKDALEEQSQNIELAIIDVASLCSGCDSWNDLKLYLQQAGHQVSPELDEQMMVFDQD